MKNRFTKYGFMIIAAVLLVALAFAGAASADTASLQVWDKNAGSGSGALIDLTTDGASASGTTGTATLHISGTTWTLVLDGYTASSSSLGTLIKAELIPNLIIELKGESKLVSDEDKGSNLIFVDDGDLTIKAASGVDGKLILTRNLVDKLADTISVEGGNLRIEGENTIVEAKIIRTSTSVPQQGASSIHAFNTRNNFDITSGATVTATVNTKTEAYGIGAEANLTISGEATVTLDISGGEYAAAINAGDGVTITSSTVTATANCEGNGPATAIDAGDDVTITSSTVSATAKSTSEKASAIKIEDGSLFIASSSKVTLTAESAGTGKDATGIYFDNNGHQSISISSNSEVAVIAKNTASTGNAYGFDMTDTPEGNEQESSLSVTGSAKLKVTATSNVSADGFTVNHLEVESKSTMTVDVTGGDATYVAIRVEKPRGAETSLDGNIAIKGESTVTASVKCTGTGTRKNVAILTNDISISSSTVKATVENSGTSRTIGLSADGEIAIDGLSDVTAKATGSVAYGIFGKSITIDGCKVLSSEGTTTSFGYSATEGTLDITNLASDYSFIGDANPITYNQFKTGWTSEGNFNISNYKAVKIARELKPEVSVKNWAELKQAVEEWTKTDKTRTITVLNSITDSAEASTFAGLNVTGKITVIPKAGTDVTIGLGKQHGRLFSVNGSGADLKLVGNQEGTITIAGGKMDLGHGGAVQITNDGKFTLAAGAKITDCSAIMGGAVYLNGGTLTMEDESAMSSCTANIGGAVCMYGTSNTFTMTGGEITDCSATFTGGGVDVSGTFSMSGGCIQECESASDGGGVRVGGDGIFEVSGTAKVFFNTKTNTEDRYNVYLFDDARLKLVGDFTGKIGITNPIAVGKFGVIENDATGAEYFISDTLSDIEGVVASADGTDLVWTAGRIAEDDTVIFGNPGEDNTTILPEQTDVSGVLLEMISGLSPETIITFVPETETETGEVGQLSGYTKVSDVSIFDANLVMGSISSGSATMQITVTFTDDAAAEKNKNNVRFVHYDTANSKWETSPLASSIVTDQTNGKDVTYDVTVTSFSPFAISIQTKNSSGSSHQGGSRILPATDAPTVRPTQQPTTDATPLMPTVKPTQQPTQKSPAPFVGLVLGLGAAAALLRLRK